MKLRVSIVVVIVLLAGSAAWWFTRARVTQDIAGVYAQRGDMPEGQRMRLEIRPDGRWVMANMLSGFWGTWSKRNAEFLFTSTDGPAGPTKPETIEVAVTQDTVTMQGDLVFDRLDATEPFRLQIEP